MSEGDKDSKFEIYKSETKSIQESKEVQVKGSSKEDTKEFFDEVWENDI